MWNFAKRYFWGTNVANRASDHLRHHLPSVLALLIGFELVLPFVGGLDNTANWSTMDIWALGFGAASLLCFTISLITSVWPEAPGFFGKRLLWTYRILVLGAVCMISSVAMVTIDSWSSLGEGEPRNPGARVEDRPIQGLGDDIPDVYTIKAGLDSIAGAVERNSKEAAGIKNGLDSVTSAINRISVELPEPSHTSSWEIALILLGLAGAGIFLVVFSFARKTGGFRTKAAGLVVGLGFTGCSLLGSLVKIDNFSLVLPDITWSSETGPDGLIVSQDSIVFEHVDAVAFRTGECSSSVNSLEYLLSALRANDSSTLINLTLVGRADRRPLSDSLRVIHGSNAGLASARAEWVKAAILRRFQPRIDSSIIVTCVSGPTTTSLSTIEHDLANDRRVDVYSTRAVRK